MMLYVSATDQTRLLIATGEAAENVDELPLLIRTLIESATEILVITPILVSRLRWLASDTDRARYEADASVSAPNSRPRRSPRPASRDHGADRRRDSADGVRRRDPRVPAGSHPVALRSADHDAWQERGLMDALRSAFHIPMTVFEIDQAGLVPTAEPQT